MTSKYASLLFSPEEYHSIGPFRFPVYHDLVPGEARGIEKISRKQSKQAYQSIKLAKRIAEDRKITVREAIDLLSNKQEEDNNETQDLLLNYAGEMESLQADAVSPYEQQIEFVTLFMQYRAEAKIEGRQWKRLSDWTQADTEEMPTKVMQQIFDLIMWERDGWPSEGKQTSSEPEPSLTTTNS
jgi:hypothetical protein